jgi:hypothetical protein
MEDINRSFRWRELTEKKRYIRNPIEKIKNKIGDPRCIG